MATPTAASTPAAETLKDAKAPFVLEAVLALPVVVPVLLAPVFVENVSVGVADVGGYEAPKALTSKGCETA
jgi:hypothetical protein